MPTRQYGAIIAFLLLSSAADAQTVLRLKTRQTQNRMGPRNFEDASTKHRTLGRTHVIIQYNKPPTTQQLEALEECGATILRPVPDNAVLVSAPDQMSSSALGLHQALVLTPRQKISPLLRAEEGELPRTHFLVEFHPDVSTGGAREIILREGLDVQENPDLIEGQLLVRGESGQMLDLAAWDEVAYIFPASIELQQGKRVIPCTGGVAALGAVGQYIDSYGPGWDGAGQNATAISYSFEWLTDQMPYPVAVSEIERALSEWSKYIQVDFSYSEDISASRNLNFLFGTGDHGDRFPFDGPRGVVAHSFYPFPPNPEPTAGDLHFDDDEIWQVGDNMDIFSVALHELGHALGLGHADEPSAVMYPYYGVASGINEIDISAIRQLYAATEVASQSGKPSPTSVSPSGGSGVSQAYTFTFSHTSGWQNLGVVNILINDSLDGYNACYLGYDQPSNQLFLMNDPGSAMLPGLILDGSGTLGNSSCTISGAGSSAVGSADTLTLTLDITFSTAFVGNRIMYLAASDLALVSSGWQALGTWTVMGRWRPQPTAGGARRSGRSDSSRRGTHGGAR
jgi:matrixin